MSDLKLTKDGDLLIENGQLVLTQTIEEDAVQRTQIRLLTFRGEWFLDDRIGIPYFQQILRKGVDKTFVDAIFKNAILSDPAITSMDTFESSIVSGKYHLRFVAVTRSGELTGTTLAINLN